MPLKDVNASSEQLAQLSASQLRYKRLKEEERQREEARTSDELVCTDSFGNTWTYLTVDGEYVRIVGCDAHSTRLVIPEEIGGLPVWELAVDCCSSLEGVEEIVCGPDLQEIGQAAFRRNKQLKRCVLPANMDRFDYTWVKECPLLEELVLPGQVARLDSSVFFAESLRRLSIGPGTCEIVPGAFAKSALEYIEVDPANEHIYTDGQALITRDGKTLVVFAVGSTTYRVPDGIELIAKKAFSGHRELVDIQLPQSLKTIGPYGLSRTGLRAFVAPPNLERIEERGFFASRELKSAQLNEGLRYIGDNAFDATALEHLQAPNSIEDIGVRIVPVSIMTFGGPDAGFSIAKGAKVLYLDEFGGLYRARENGTHFVRMLDPRLTSYHIQDGTRVIDERAFARHTSIRSVVIPEGVEIIDPGAFKTCGSLKEVSLPSTLRAIGEEAFFDTALERIDLPAGLERLGERAIVTEGSHHGDMPPQLREITVGEGNERFFVDQGMLCERVDDASIQVVMYTDSQAEVRIPENVVRVCDFAFNGARRLRRFYISDSIRRMGTCALAVRSSLELLHVDLTRPVKGHSSFDLRFPQTERSAHEIELAFSTTTWVNIEKIIKHYDNAVVNMHDYGTRGIPDVDVYAQTTRMLERLLDPVLMTKVHKSMYDYVITHNLENICLVIARNDDRSAIDALIELGYLNEDNLVGIIDAVGNLQDAAMTGYLLEIKRRMFKRSAIDFDL